MNIEMQAPPRAKAGKKRAAAAVSHAADAMKAMAKRIRRYFRDKYDDLKVREGISSDYGVCRRTAGLWMSSGPTSRHLATMIEKEGMPFVETVIHPIAKKDPIDARLDARQQALEAQLAAERADLEADVASGGTISRRRRDRAVSVIGALKARLRREAV